MVKKSKAVVHEIPEFEASVSVQGKDRHLHLPRRMYQRLDTMGLMGKKFKFRILAEEIEE